MEVRDSVTCIILAFTKRLRTFSLMDMEYHGKNMYSVGNNWLGKHPSPLYFPC